eukprot:CAMPEP_0206042896 /NCGR_PEP_ID=MMETSP1466-20131121/7053_1 /ASSEMBLY_ACC=CAM_ASM_001126 /TAXON_ID=44452 /ORGANISM="Pavlova gyrans, Strain CCMP608" /LENGTH=53 /DNA_ID=CAMNT_0053417629 /DNA_START=64 /DNA_END=221 /DNA_ORIENTATION=-
MAGGRLKGSDSRAHGNTAYHTAALAARIASTRDRKRYLARPYLGLAAGSGEDA